ncbi:P-loop containing nucleoside triphosphate hydrolase protein [Gorgonomyces haynaldii]|nr:P-loop containing nucleoside triphosphate hydrolase protein [Gorgonomyces haynaldii]
MVLLACVGKPSAGKSSFLNAISDASAKVGPIPFTTIKPNHGVAYVMQECPCKRFNKQELCKPLYGKCENGMRWIPIEILDVAGLVPGASEGKGLGNQFLDDLRNADALIHVVDVSGTTDAAGNATKGYDPINDIDWLQSEIKDWIYTNLKKKWTNTVRRHTAAQQNIVDTLQSQLGGYGANRTIIINAIDNFEVKDPLETWNEDTLSQFVDTFLKTRFPTVVALNKIDLPDSDKNIDKIFRKYDANEIVLTSALVETFLRTLDKQKLIRYHPGTDMFETHDEDSNLVEADEKTRKRLEKVQDLVLFRYGSTGVAECLNRAIELLGLIPVYVVRNINNFTGAQGNSVFQECMWVRPKTTVRQLAAKIHPDLDKYYNYCETVGSIRLAEDQEINKTNNILCYRVHPHS